jgi:hypothetical protein
MIKMWSRFPHPRETGFAAVRLFGALRASAIESASPYTIKKIMIFTLLIAAVAGLRLQSHL